MARFLVTIGIGMILVGGFLGGLSVLMDVSVEGPAPYSHTQSMAPERVANLDLISQRGTLAAVGGAIFIAGWVATGAGAICSALDRGLRRAKM